MEDLNMKKAIGLGAVVAILAGLGLIYKKFIFEKKKTDTVEQEQENARKCWNWFSKKAERKEDATE